MTPASRMPETHEERVLRKAGELRTACLQRGLVVSPDPFMPFAELPAERQEKWIALARAYCEIFGGRS